MLKLLRKLLGVPSREEIDNLTTLQACAFNEIGDLRRSLANELSPYAFEHERILAKLDAQRTEITNLKMKLLRQHLKITSLEIRLSPCEPAVAPLLPPDHPEVVVQRERDQRYAKGGLTGIGIAKHRMGEVPSEQTRPWAINKDGRFELNRETEGRRGETRFVEFLREANPGDPQIVPGVTVVRHENHITCAEFHKSEMVQSEFYRPTLGQLVHRVNSLAREKGVKPEYVKSKARTMVRAWPWALLQTSFRRLVAENKDKAQ